MLWVMQAMDILRDQRDQIVPEISQDEGGQDPKT